VYGSTTLAQVNQRLASLAQAANVTLQTFQSNHEGGLVDRIHAAREEQVEFVIINPAAFTHTSVAVRDALAAVAVPFVEVHLSNVHRREAFRHHSYFSDLAEAVIAGLGPYGYEAALEYALTRVGARSQQDGP
jgi:3-dehydroquinate dehydratase-2